MALAQITQLGGLQGTLDLSKYPGAQWMDANPGGGSEGAPATEAGWYMPQYSEGSYVGNVRVPDDQGPMTYDKFMALSPQQRHDFLIQGDVTQYGYAPEYGYAANLRNIVPDANSWLPLSVDQYRTILGSSGIDPSMAQGIASNLGGILDDQNRARQVTNKDRLAMAGAIATAAMAGGAGFAGAIGAGAGAGAGAAEGASAGGTLAGGGLEAGGGLAGLEGGSAFVSGLGPATGAIEGAPIIGGAGLPELSGVAAGSEPFIGAGGGLYDGIGLSSGAGGAMDMAGSAAVPSGAGGTGAGSIFEGGSASGGATAAGGAGAAAGGGTALSRFLDGTATTADYLSLGGGLGAAGLGAYAANQQTQAYTDLANKYMAMGAPYRQKLSDLYANPSSYLSSSEVQVPVQQGTDALARALSVKGNPIGSGTALQELQNYSANQLFGRLGEEKNRLAGYGGLVSYNAAAPGASQAAIGAQGGIYNSIGYGLGQLTNPPSSLEQSLRAFRGGLGSLT